MSASSRHNNVLREWALIFMELAFTLTVLSAILYWNAFYDDMMKLYKWGNYYDGQFMMFLTFLHIVPIVSTLINYLLSDVEFLKKDVTYVILLGLLYIGINFIVSKFASWHIYPFLTWVDINSVIAAIIFILLLVGIFYVLVMITALIPRRGEQTIE
jgi:hypothetical protein